MLSYTVGVATALLDKAMFLARTPEPSINRPCRIGIKAMPFLAGDIGGTKSLLELGQIERGSWITLRTERLPSRRFSSLEELIATFLPPGTEIEAACFGVAGPVIGGRSRLTHLRWLVEEDRLSRVLGGTRVKLLNDLEAAGWALLDPAPIEKIALQEGQGEGNRAIIAAGTGLGEALLIWVDGTYRVQPTEGGHCDFAPTTPLQLELLSWLWREVSGRVSFDDLLSGRGLERLYRFFRLRSGLGAIDLPAPEVSRRALSGEDPQAEEALRLWCEIYGAEGGNLVLKSLALGGLFIAGGIAPKVSGYLKRYFLAPFLGKGRFRDLLTAVPVWLILEEELVLRGAKSWILRTAMEQKSAP